MGADRQPGGLACRRLMMGALLTGGLLWALPSQAELAVTLGAPDPAPVAPAALTVTASVSGDDPVLEYAWQGLDAWPVCEGARCPLTLALAGCRQVAVEVTGISGATARAERVVCATDGEAAPPRARIRFAEGADGRRVGREVQAGAALVRLERLFVDQAEVVGGEVLIEDDGGCHAVDLLVVDAAGRTGEDHQQLCFQAGAPRPRLFADPAGCVQDDLQALCADHRHPLGLALTSVEGVQGPMTGCAERQDTPRAFTRYAATVEDPTGARGTASLFACRAPASGVPTLPWPVAEGARLGVNDGEVLGGEAPFTVRAALESDAVGRAELTVEAGQDRNFSFIVPDFQVPDAEYVVRLFATDARGLSTEVRLAVTLTPPGPDAGVVDSGRPPGTVFGDSAACDALGPQGAAPLMLLLLGWPWLTRRRRPCS